MGTRRTAAAAALTALCLAATATPAQASTIKGTPDRDKLHGTARADVVYGYGGNDDLDGRRGTDRLYGGGGHDFLKVTGGDRAFGGPGKDVFNAFDVTKATYIDCGPGYDSVYYEPGKKPKAKRCEIVQTMGEGRPTR